MIIDYLNVECIAVLKAKANPPLVIDPDTPLPAAVMPQRFQSVRRWQAQILDTCGRIQLNEPHSCALVDLRGNPARLAGRVDVFRFVISKRPNHTMIINNMFTNVKPRQRSRGSDPVS